MIGEGEKTPKPSKANIETGDTFQSPDIYCICRHGSRYCATNDVMAWTVVDIKLYLLLFGMYNIGG